MDITITNDYTRDSMLKGCDDVIDIINKMILGTQEVANSSLRKSDRDLLKELGDSRIEEGASRVENCELFKFKLQEKEVEDFEK